MGWLELYPHQIEALPKIRNGCILNGGVGSGKSRESLAYYYIRNGGDVNAEDYVRMKDPPKDLIIITTAQKRDKHEWDGELSHFIMSTDPELNLYHNKIVVDSWQNIRKYVKVKNSFFIFDEQRLVGSGVWVNSFYKIADNNEWIMLSATPGDCWKDYIPVFVANGFYKNKTEFVQNHIIYNPRVNFPQVQRYVGTKRLIRLRDKILIPMNFERSTVEHHEKVYSSYDRSMYRWIRKEHKNPFEGNIPIEQASSMCFILRKLVNSDPSRADAVLKLCKEHRRAIIFYNYDYELDILKNIPYDDDTCVAEWNGHKHEEVPDTKKWVYLVQYNAGSEGWNCIKTDTIIFYSSSYSYRIMEQACGRINRLNTPYIDLYYYHIMSSSNIDMAIAEALREKKKFNERKFVGAL